jgi:hypothetical protein
VVWTSIPSSRAASPVYTSRVFLSLICSRNSFKNRRVFSSLVGGVGGLLLVLASSFAGHRSVQPVEIRAVEFDSLSHPVEAFVDGLQPVL